MDAVAIRPHRAALPRQDMVFLRTAFSVHSIGIRWLRAKASTQIW